MTIYSDEFILSLLDIVEDEPLYADANAEIQAVRDGQKTIARYLCDIGDLDTLETLVRDAQSDLVLTVRAVTDDELHVYLNHPQESWRVQALTELSRLARGGVQWCDGLEMLQSRLLGYSEEQIDNWLQVQHARQIGWVGGTVYILMSTEHRNNLSRYGWRCLNPSDVDKQVIFCPRMDFALKRPPQLPTNVVLCRVAISHNSFRNILGSFDRDDQLVLIRELNSSVAIEINKSMCSYLEFLDGMVWKSLT